MTAIEENCQPGSVRLLCESMGVSRATFYRRRAAPPSQKPRPPSHRRLGDVERSKILDVLCSERFVDSAPRQVFAKLLEEGHFYCSYRTMYRILKDHDATRERRDQRRHPKHAKPQLNASAPNQVWTWDITKVAGPCKGTVYCLYVVLDLYSRYIVSWTLEPNECSLAAQRVIEHGVKVHEIKPKQLTVHADRGSPMTSSGLYAVFSELGVTGSHSRPRVSNDNAFIESQFKTAKYHHRYPKRFESIRDGEIYFTDFFDWYNNHHHHTKLGLFTPSQVFDGSYRELQQVRQATLDKVYRQHPERFVKGPPIAPTVPTIVSINPDDPEEQVKGVLRVC